MLILIGAVSAFCNCLGQAPEGWKRLSEPKEINTGKAIVKEVGVWRSADADVTVQMLRFDAIKTEQGVWNLVGGLVSGLSKSGQAPSSSEVIQNSQHLYFRLIGQGKQEGGAVGALDTYVVLANSGTYIVKAFRRAESTGFSMSGWDFGPPITAEREECTRALLQIKARLDAGQSLNASTPAPAHSTSAEEDFESAKNATDDELRGDLRIWTRLIDQTKEHAVNLAKRSGKAIDVDAELKPYLRRLANNRFFSISREHALHPAYRRELSKVAAIRGQDVHFMEPESQVGYAVGRYGPPLAILIFVISRWTRRLSRKTAVELGTSRSAYYGKLLLKMSWRVALLVILSFLLVFAAHLAPAFSENEVASAIVVTIALFLVFLPPAVLVTSWSQTKRRFAEATGSSHRSVASAAKEAPMQQSAELHQVTVKADGEPSLLSQQPEIAASHKFRCELDYSIFIGMVETALYGD